MTRMRGNAGFKRLLVGMLAAVTLCLISILSISVNVNASENAAAAPEKFAFQAEVSRMMDIIINSLYQKKEVFLREIISNSADALDKIRFLALRNPDEMKTNPNLEIKIKYIEEEKKLVIKDTGVGMTRQELIDNLGTLAKSGTTNFVEQLANTGDLNLIGQFGVGFYSVYLVADKVQVRSKNNQDADQWIWESSADSTFTVVKDESGESLGRGTEITLHLKDEALEYMNPQRLTALVQRYSEFIGFPIYLYRQVEVKESSEADSAEEEEEEDDEEEEGDDEDLETEQEEEKSGEPKKVWQWSLINSQKAIWTRSPSEIEPIEYSNFYSLLTKDEEGPLTWTHFKAEGEVEFKSILFVPKKAPYGFYDRYHDTKPQLRLYVRKVLIKDDFEDLVPNWLNFLRGVVDSDDLPLSVSRETLQQAKAVKVIGKKLTRKALDMLARMAQKEIKAEIGAAEDADADDEEGDEEMDEEQVAQYNQFFTQFGRNLKIGYIEDHANQERISKLLRFKSSAIVRKELELPGGMVSLEGYVKRMKPFQKSIFYLTGENVDSMLKSPLVKKALAKGVEVLLMDEPLDEYVLQSLRKFDDFDFVSLAKDGLKFGDESEVEKKREEEYKRQFKGLKKWLKKDVYNNDDAGGKSGTVSKVEISTTSIDENIPAVVVAASHGNSATMERIMKSQTMGDGSKHANAGGKILALNPRNPIINELNAIYEKDTDKARDIAWLLWDTSLVESGFEIDDKALFSDRMYRLMKSGLSLSSLEPLPWIDVPEESDDDEEVQVDDEVKEDL